MAAAAGGNDELEAPLLGSDMAADSRESSSASGRMQGCFERQRGEKRVHAPLALLRRRVASRKPIAAAVR